MHRKQLERLARYITRPPLSQERRTYDDGLLFLGFKKPWKDGSLGLVLQPEDLLVRLCAAVPPPRFHMVRYYGVLSSHSSSRSRVVPELPQHATCHRLAPAAGDEDECSSITSMCRWAWMLAHVFRVDVEICLRYARSAAAVCVGSRLRRLKRRPQADGAARLCSATAPETPLRPTRSAAVAVRQFDN